MKNRTIFIIKSIAFVILLFPVVAVAVFTPPSGAQRNGRPLEPYWSDQIQALNDSVSYPLQGYNQRLGRPNTPYWSDQIAALTDSLLSYMKKVTPDSNVYATVTRLADSLKNFARIGGNITPSDMYLGTQNANHLAFITNNVIRAHYFNNGNFAYNATTNDGTPFRINAVAKIDTRLGVGGAATSAAIIDAIGNSTGMIEAISARNSNASGSARIGFRYRTGSGHAAYFDFFNSANLLGITNEAGAMRFLAYGDIYWQLSGTELFRMTRDPNISYQACAKIGGGSIVAGASLALEGTQSMFQPNKTTGSQIEAAPAKPDGGIFYIPSGAGNGTVVNSSGWWGYNGTTFVKFQTIP